jgi:TRAP transporter TAXI family solute receptor
MKKLLSITLIIVISAILIMGCSQPQLSEEGTQEKTGLALDVDINEIKMAVGGAGGGWYIAGAAMGAVWEKNLNGLATTLVPGGGLANPTRINNGQEMVGFTYITNAVGAEKGLEPYDKKHENMLGMINLNIRQYYHFMVLKNKKVTSYEQMIQDKIGIKISPGPRGSGSENATALIFKELGIGYEDLKKWGGSFEFSSPGDAVDKIRDGHLDTYGCMTTVGDPTTVDLAVSRKMSFIPLEDEMADVLVEKYGYIKDSIPSGTYEGQTGDVPTICDSVILVVNKDAPEDFVYNLVKILIEKEAELKKVHAIFKDFKAEEAPQIPLKLHPGAEKYYKEKGLL